MQEFLPNHSRGAYDDPRLNLVIDDGMRFVASTEEKFDVIISDSTDPIGPGEVLFSENFYQACRRCLNEGGILVTQNGTPFMQLGEVQTTAGRMNGLFADWHFYQAAVPTYIGGSMTFAWGATHPESRKVSLETLRQRFAGSGIVTRYYNPEIHLGAFALPQYVLRPSANRATTESRDTRRPAKACLPDGRCRSGFNREMAREGHRCGTRPVGANSFAHGQRRCPDRGRQPCVQPRQQGNPSRPYRS